MGRSAKLAADRREALRLLGHPSEPYDHTAWPVVEYWPSLDRDGAGFVSGKCRCGRAIKRLYARGNLIERDWYHLAEGER